MSVTWSDDVRGRHQTAVVMAVTAIRFPIITEWAVR